MSGDWCTNDGAKRLKDKIENYWRDKGFDVDIDLVDAGFVAAMRSGRTDVRSNMVNGMPKRRARSSRVEAADQGKSPRPDHKSGWIRQDF